MSQPQRSKRRTIRERFSWLPPKAQIEIITVTILFLATSAVRGSPKPETKLPGRLMPSEKNKTKRGGAHTEKPHFVLEAGEPLTLTRTLVQHE